MAFLKSATVNYILNVFQQTAFLPSVFQFEMSQHQIFFTYAPFLFLFPTYEPKTDIYNQIIVSAVLCWCKEEKRIDRV